MIRHIHLALCLLLCLPEPILAAASRNKPEAQTVKGIGSTKDDTLTIVYIGKSPSGKVIHPFYDPEPNDLGLRGAELGLDDNNTTGRFTGQNFKIKTALFDDSSKMMEQFKRFLAENQTYFLIDASPDDMLQLARLPEAKDAILMDIANSEDRLRGRDCQSNIFFLMPSDAMRTDALAQYFSKKHWQKWFLVRGEDEHDVLYAEAVRRSAKKFGAKIVKDSVWSYNFDDRRSPESEVPVFTQGDDYDLVVVSDHLKQFADLFPYRTWQPRPVAGDAGLVAVAWHKTHETWGALQLQSRFKDKYSRPMQEKDYTGWLAARSLGEAATRSHSTLPARIRSMLTDPAFALAGFKGVPLSFRTWDHQMRQPLLLGADRSIAGFAPVEGYLHPSNTLDTLGYDAPESTCKHQTQITPN